MYIALTRICFQIRNLKERGMEFMSVPDTYYQQLKENLKLSKVKIVEDMSILEVQYNNQSVCQLIRKVKQMVIGNAAKSYWPPDSQLKCKIPKQNVKIMWHCLCRNLKSWWIMMTMATCSRSSLNQYRTGPLCF